MISSQHFSRFEHRVVLALCVTALMTVRCGETPSFTESDPAQASLRNTSGGTGNYNSDDATSAGERNGDKTSENGIPSVAGQPTESPKSGSNNDGDSGYGNPGNEYPLNLVAGSDSAIIQTQSKVDILWIVDSSGSMAEEQTYLGQNFSSFMNQLLAIGTDFQTGITTTDICSSANPATVPMAERYCPVLDGTSSSHFRGSLVGTNGLKVLKPSMSDISSRFLQYANVGIQGSSFEHGLKATEMAVAKSLAGQNEGLVRSDAFLAVIVVSDEEDDGIGLGKTDVYTGRNYVAEGYTSFRYTEDHLIGYLNNAKGSGNFSISTITGTRNSNGSMCSSAHSQPLEEGTQYISAANKTGGIVQSICDTNWSSSLASIGRDIAGQSAQIALSNIPYQNTISVRVNGVINTQWTYSAGNNSIKFNAGFVPSNGSNISVNYMYAP